MPLPETEQAEAVVVRSHLLREVPHGFGTRHGGVSPSPFATLNVGLSTRDSRQNVEENRRRLFLACRIPGRVLSARLNHGTDVSVFRKSDYQDGATSLSEASSFHSDGVVSDTRGLAFLMTFADCVPLLFCDPSRKVVGMAHAGWRGTSLRIAEAMVREMSFEFGCDPSDIMVCMGPSIGPCCYDVGSEVLSDFGNNQSNAVTSRVGDRWLLDLWATNRSHLLSSGIKEQNIDLLRVCTSCRVEDYFSHRAEHGLTGRSGACIGLEANA
jgi:YfiH family protein